MIPTKSTEGIELLSIDLSNYCSKQCPFCYNHSRREGNTVWTPSEVTAFVDDCVKHGVKAVSLGGGEPFEYDGIFALITALYPMVYLSITSNGLPLEQSEVWQQLQEHRPDKIHLTIHQPHLPEEVERVCRRVRKIGEVGIKPGVNLLVGADQLPACQEVYARLTAFLAPDQIILVPQRFGNTPTPQQLAAVAQGRPFQSPSCLLHCTRPTRFASVSWDKRVNACSFAGGKQPLTSLTYAGLLQALQQVSFKSCDTTGISI